MDISKDLWSKNGVNVRDFIKTIYLRLKDNMFHGDDPIRVLNFLAHFVREPDSHIISDSKEMIVLQSFVNRF